MCCQQLRGVGLTESSHASGFVVGEDFEAIGYEPPPPATFNQHWLRAPEGRRVTLVVTSCGRLPGLRRTIASFLAANTYPIDRYLIMEDSGDVRMAGRVIEEFGDVFDVVVNKRRMGQLFSVDKAYSLVHSDFVFHCEDDWVFNGIPHMVRGRRRPTLHTPKPCTLNPKP